MPGVCGDYLKRENREGPRHKIIAGCAIEFLKNAIVRKIGEPLAHVLVHKVLSLLHAVLVVNYSVILQKTDKKFDYVFGDLTDTPVSTSDRSNDIWNFLESIISMGMTVLKANTGKYMTHCNGINVPQAIAAYEQMLGRMSGGRCTFERRQNFVPSFSETWMYYRITRHE